MQFINRRDHRHRICTLPCAGANGTQLAMKDIGIKALTSVTQERIGLSALCRRFWHLVAAQIQHV